MPSRPSAKKKSSSIDTSISPAGILALVAIVILISGGIYLSSRRNTNTKKTTISVKPIPTPTPIQLRPDDGVKGTYNVSQGKHAGPTVTKIVFDPLDAKKGQPLTITARITNATPIQKVTGTLEMDHGLQNVIFERTSGTELDSEWQTTMTLQDSVLYAYILKITATATNGVNTVGIAPRSR